MRSFGLSDAKVVASIRHTGTTRKTNVSALRLSGWVDEAPLTLQSTQGDDPHGRELSIAWQGARALHIYRRGVDTLYRLHGSSDVTSIGQAVSSGCVRLLQRDIIDLYEQVPEHTPIVVL